MGLIIIMHKAKNYIIRTGVTFLHVLDTDIGVI